MNEENISRSNNTPILTQRKTKKNSPESNNTTNNHEDDNSIRTDLAMFNLLSLLSIERLLSGQGEYTWTNLHAIALILHMILLDFRQKFGEKLCYFISNLVLSVTSLVDLFFIVKYTIDGGIEISFIKWLECIFPGSILAIIYMLAFCIYKKRITFQHFGIEYPSKEPIIIFIVVLVITNFILQFPEFICLIGIGVAKLPFEYYYNSIIFIFHLLIVYVYGNRTKIKPEFFCFLYCLITPITISLSLFGLKEKILN